MIRIGHSKDIHRLKKGRILRLGGVDIESSFEAIGHSDADCLLHSIAEALLGALALGDLGTFYPDTSDATKNMDSMVILKEVYEKVRARGFKLVNSDSMVLLETPKLRNHINVMREVIATALGVSLDQISIKATTGEKVGIIGNSEAILCETVLCVEKVGAQGL